MFLSLLSRDHRVGLDYKPEYLLQDPDVDLESSGDMLILSPVSRKDSGIYQCRPLDTDDYAEVKGEMLLTVHCEERTKKHIYTNTHMYNITTLLILVISSQKESE